MDVITELVAQVGVFPEDVWTGAEGNPFLKTRNYACSKTRRLFLTASEKIEVREHV